MKIKLLFLFLFSASLALAQDNFYYQTAFTEIQAMLSGKKALNFKKTVYHVENAFFDNQLDSNDFNKEVRKIILLAKGFHQANPISNYTQKDKATVALWGAVFKVMTDTVTILLPNGEKAYHLPFTYDFEDYFGEQDWTKMFVTKLLATRKGNCHSLPFLYKILCEELGVSANLALAPNHIYIKHRAEKTGWYNTELTSAAFPIDAWLMASGYIHLSAIQNSVYMKALTDQESIALCLVDLAEGYKRKTNGQDTDFILKCCNTALQYFPNCVNALILKAETLKQIFEKTQNKQTFNEIQDLYLQIHDLGYRQMPKEMYLNWLMELRTDKDKYLNKNLIDVQNKK
ncbi:hypothetical protein [Thermoflexibacter ruber]|uniref:Transglutaminase-like superfamily protein n=1 Tax=Thermoflexibacter ruber TaxID=1003 RepID=A0A1I2JYB2_9BACT|nr:hypothetical protein [Thermoflexibacter ruber]SFF57821.1 hypothetical protein SAMN04488541_106510 [Thermoflexibacter ruber]